MWRRAALIVVVLALGVAVAVVYGNARWNSDTLVLRERLEAARTPPVPGTSVHRAEDIATLPAPVQRYFRVALSENQPLVAAVSIEHTGTFDMGENAAQWKPFTSTQRVVTRPPGFDWDARIAVVPGIAVHVHDAYVAGAGLLRASVLGLVPVADLQGSGDLAQGELMRYLAEAAWYPTALLPSQGVRWQAIDANSARATLADGSTSVSLVFRFGDDGLIDTVRADARGRTVANTVIPTPWMGRFWNYAVRDGMRIPLEGEVAWIMPEGTKPYWRGRANQVRYEFAQSSRP
jgi:hypothetical protein